MAKAAARAGDKLNAAVKVPPYQHKYTVSNTTTPYTCNFSGAIQKSVSADVLIGGVAAAIQNSESESGAHDMLDGLTGGTWASAPVNTAQVTGGSGTVLINGKAAVRDGDSVSCCTTDGTVSVQNAATATVLIGD